MRMKRVAKVFIKKEKKNKNSRKGQEVEIKVILKIATLLMVTWQLKKKRRKKNMMKVDRAIAVSFLSLSF